MDAFLTEWLNLALRWIHIITGIAWIGSSFYFNWLDSKLRAPKSPRPGIESEAWLVHSGGFYRVEKIMVAPEQLPEELHWFKWEAAFTWLSGMALLILLYHLGGGAYLLNAPAGGFSDLLGLAGLVLGLAACWAIYDRLWASPLGERPALAWTIFALLLAIAAWALTRLMSGQAAYIHIGALIGTLMAANVWLRILPAQRQLVAAAKAGTRADARLAHEAKKRSLHNNYLTLPILFIMLSGHFPSTFGHEWNWLILGLLTVVGVGVRHAFNLRNRGRAWAWLLPLAAALFAGLYAWLR